MLGGAVTAFLMGPFNGTIGLMSSIINESPFKISELECTFYDHLFSVFDAISIYFKSNDLMNAFIFYQLVLLSILSIGTHLYEDSASIFMLFCFFS